MLGACIAWALVTIKPESNQPEPPNEVPPVDVIRVTPQTMTLKVRAQGVITPRTEIDLVPEVAGRITKLHTAFVTGEVFNAGDSLITIDPRDYDVAITNAQAQIAEAKHRLALEQAEAEQARHEWETLGGRYPPTPLMLREPQLVEVHAKLKAAKADLAQALLQRSRCEWRAPFAGKIRSKSIGLGQYVQPGSAVARLYSVDTAEVRLPLTMDQLNYLEWPWQQGRVKNKQTTSEQDIRPRVNLAARLAGTMQQWKGRIIRIDSAIDETTGLLYAVAEINYLQQHYDDQQQLLPGLFVNAEIEGREQRNIFKLPREAINADRQILLIDKDGRIRSHPVNILRVETDHILVSGGLDANDLVVISTASSLIDGLKVETKLVELDMKPSAVDSVVLSNTLTP